MGSGEVDRGKELVRAKRRTGLFQDVSGTYVHRVPRSAVLVSLWGNRKHNHIPAAPFLKSLTFYNKISSVMHKGQTSKRRRQKSGNTSVPVPHLFCRNHRVPVSWVSLLCVGFTSNTVTPARAERPHCAVLHCPSVFYAIIELVLINKTSLTCDSLVISKRWQFQS